MSLFTNCSPKNEPVISSSLAYPSDKLWKKVEKSGHVKVDYLMPWRVKVITGAATGAEVRVPVEVGTGVDQGVRVSTARGVQVRPEARERAAVLLLMDATFLVVHLGHLHVTAHTVVAFRLTHNLY